MQHQFTTFNSNAFEQVQEKPAFSLSYVILCNSDFFSRSLTALEPVTKCWVFGWIVRDSRFLLLRELCDEGLFCFELLKFYFIEWQTTKV
jgi:hypothetical protein